MLPYNTRTTVGITAYAGGGAANATKLNDGINVIATCATAADSVILPAYAGPGEVVTVINAGAAAAAVFPPTGGTINGGAANAAVNVTNAKASQYICVDTTGAGLTWRTLAGA